MPVRNQFNPLAVLPRRFRFRITKVDADHAVCGAATECTIARAIERHLRHIGMISPEERRPRDFYIKVKSNRIMVRVKNTYHNYSVPDAAADIIRQTDAGDYELVRETSLTLALISTAHQTYDWRDPNRRAQINAARQLRRAEGRPDKAYPNERIEAAIRNRVRGKKLGELSPAA